MVGVPAAVHDRNMLSPGARRLALIRALEDQHKMAPHTYAQHDGALCARATARRIGLDLGVGEHLKKSLDLTSKEYHDIFGADPWEGTAQDAADRLKVIHNRKIGWLGRLMGKAA